MKNKKIAISQLAIHSFVTNITFEKLATVIGGDVGSLSCGGPDCDVIQPPVPPAKPREGWMDILSATNSIVSPRDATAQ